MMSEITAISVQKKNPNRVSIYLDGEYAFGLSRLVAAWLSIGDQLDEEKIARLKHKDTFEVAYQKVMHFLGYKARTEKEIVQKLSKEGYTQELIEEITLRLRQQGLIEDQTLSNDWVQARGQSKPRGRRMLALELRRRGIADQIIQQALAEAGDEEELALRAAMKYGHRLEGLNRNVFRQKMSAYLARRGFEYSAISVAVHQVWEQMHSASGLQQLPNGEIDDE